MPRETNSVGYLRWTSADLSSEGSGCTMNRNIQEEQNGKMPESNLRVHGSSRAAPSTAASQVQGTPERRHQMCRWLFPEAMALWPFRMQDARALQLRPYPPTTTGSQPGFLFCSPPRPGATTQSVRSAVFLLTASAGASLGSPRPVLQILLLTLVRPTSTSHTNSHS